MRTLNLRFAAGLLAVLSLFGVGVFFVHRVQSNRIASDILWQVQHARESGQADDAIRFAYQYLEWRPDDTNVLLELAGWLEERPGGRRHLLQVTSLFDRVLQIDPARADIRRKVVTLKLRTGRHGECLDALERLMPEFAGDAELLATKGVCQDAVGKHAEAAESFEQALKADPKRVTTSIDYAEVLYRHLHRPDDARRVLEAAASANPENASARLAVARFYKAMGKFAEAEAAAKQAVGLAPEDLAALTAAADACQAMGKFAQARDLMQRAARLAPKNSRVACSLAWLLLYDGKTGEAVARLEETLRENPSDADTLTLLGDILALDGRLDALAKVVDDLDRIRKIAPERAWNADYLRSRLLMRRGDWRGAIALLDPLRQTTSRNPALARQANYLLAQCYEQTRDRPNELEAYRRVLAADPSAGFFRLEYSRALARAGDYSTAVKEFRTAVQRPDLPPRAVVDATWELADRSRRAGAAAASKELDRLFEPVRSDDDSLNAVLAKVTLLRLRLRFNDALQIANQYVAKHPGHTAMIAERVRLLDCASGPEKAAAALADAERRLGDHADFRVARLRLLGPRTDSSQGAALFANAAGLDRLGTDDRSRVLTELVGAIAVTGNDALSSRALRHLADARPDHLAARAALLTRAAAASDDAAVQALLTEVAIVEGQGGWTRKLFDAERLIARMATAPELASAARSALDELNRNRPGDPVVELYLGQLAELMDQTADAMRHYTRALENGLLDGPVEDRIAALARSSAKKSRSFVQDSPLFDRLRLETDRSLVRLLLPMAPASSRSGLADRLLRANPDASPPQLVWLGRQFQSAGLSRHAEAAFTRATQIARYSDEAWAARINHNAGKQDFGKIAELVEQSLTVMPGPDGAVTMARALEAAGLPAEGLKVLQKAVAGHSGQSGLRRQYAQSLLQLGRLVEGRQQLQAIVGLAKPPADDLAWARRTLAISLTVGPTLPAFQQSLKLIEANKGLSANADEDSRALAAVYAAQRSRPIADGRTARQEAIRILNGLETRTPTCQVDDLILLARLYRAEGDGPSWERVRGRLEQQFPDNSASICYLAREALRAGALAEADRLLARLESVDGGRFETRALRFTHLALCGDVSRARALFDEFTSAADGPARAARQVRCGHAAFDLLTGYPLADKQPVADAVRDAAVDWYRAGLGRDPQALLNLVTLSCKGGRIDAALDLLQSPSVRTNFTVEAQAAAAVTAMHHGRPSPEQRQAVERMLAGLARQNPGSVALQLAHADLLDQLGKTDEAVAVYRRVLDKDPDNAMALNNLAWTLSYDPGKMDEARRLIAEAIDRNGPLDELLDTRGRVLFAAGEKEAGLRDLREAAVTSPSAARFFCLAVLYRRADRPDLAGDALRKARQFGFDPGDLHPRDAGDYRELLTRN